MTLIDHIERFIKEHPKGATLQGLISDNPKARVSLSALTGNDRDGKPYLEWHLYLHIQDRPTSLLGYKREAPGEWISSHCPDSDWGKPNRRVVREDLAVVFPDEVKSITPDTWWSVRTEEIATTRPPTTEERSQPVKVASYSTGEYIAALWVFGDILVKSSLRMHGHGEIYLDAKKPGDAEWTELGGEMPLDFGRQADKAVRKMMFQGLPPLASEIATFWKYAGGSGSDQDAQMAFNDALTNFTLDGLAVESDTFQVHVLYERESEMGQAVDYAVFRMGQDFMREFFYQKYGPFLQQFERELGGF